MPQISYAGVPLLLEDPGREFAAWLARYLDTESRRLFGHEPGALREGRYAPRSAFTSRWDGASAPRVGLGTQNHAQWRPPEWRINTLWWPTGATRWGVGLFLADETRVDAIVDGLESDGTGTLVIKSDRQSAGPRDAARAATTHATIAAQMILLPPLQLSNTYAGTNGYLLAVVDERWAWQWKDAGEISIDADTTWDALYAALGARLGVNLTHDTVPSAYKQPDPTELLRPHENAALLLDAVAASLGQRVVYRLDGSVHAQSAATASSRLAANEDRAALATIVAGGNGGAAKHKQALIPQKVKVVFPRACGKSGETRPEQSGEVYTVEVAQATQTIPGGGGFSPTGFLIPGLGPSSPRHLITRGLGTTSDIVVGEAVKALPGTLKVIWSTAHARFGHNATSPSNAMELNNLATQLAGDWYAWRTAAGVPYDTAYNGLSAWEPTGHDDYVWWHAGWQVRGPGRTGDREQEDASPYVELTRVASLPFNVDTAAQLTSFDGHTFEENCLIGRTASGGIPARSDLQSDPIPGEGTVTLWKVRRDTSPPILVQLTDDEGEPLTATVYNVEDTAVEAFRMVRLMWSCCGTLLVHHAGTGATEAQIVKTSPGAGIPGVSGNNVSSQNCEIFLVTGGQLVSTGEFVSVTNVQRTAVPADSYFLAVKEKKSSLWIATFDTTGGAGIIAKTSPGTGIAGRNGNQMSSQSCEVFTVNGTGQLVTTGEFVTVWNVGENEIPADQYFKAEQERTSGVYLAVTEFASGEIVIAKTPAGTFGHIPPRNAGQVFHASCETYELDGGNQLVATGKPAIEVYNLSDLAIPADAYFAAAWSASLSRWVAVTEFGGGLIAFTPSTGISGRVGDALTGEECEIFEPAGATPTLTATGQSVTIYNVSAGAIPGNIYIQAKREKMTGRWISDDMNKVAEEFVTDLRVDGTNRKFQKKTRVALITPVDVESDWTDWHTGTACPTS